jgi:glutamate/tyrosine decarboxylase-like PLP-dependent enzyme
MRHARLLAEFVDREPALERLADVQLSAVCFHWTGGDPATRDQDNAAILESVNRRGRVYLSNATVQGQFVLRVCVTNHRTKDADILAVIEEVLVAADNLATDAATN